MNRRWFCKMDKAVRWIYSEVHAIGGVVVARHGAPSRLNNRRKNLQSSVHPARSGF